MKNGASTSDLFVLNAVLVYFDIHYGGECCLMFQFVMDVIWLVWLLI